MTLTDQNAAFVDWTNDADPRVLRTGVAIELDCPYGGGSCPRVQIDFSNPIDGGAQRWPYAKTRTGTDVATLTISGTVTLAHYGGTWTGTIVDGVLTAS